MNDILSQLNISAGSRGASTGLHWLPVKGKKLKSFSPVDGKLIATVNETDNENYQSIIKNAAEAFLKWRMWPAPKRGDIVRQVGDALRENKNILGKLVSYEMGKSLQEGLGEVQEMIDICEFAVGLSRQLYGLTMHSERPGHRMYEQYHPLGIVGIISAFNFPVAVWAWNAALAWVCGDVCVWKPSEKTPICAIACQHIVAEVLERNEVPEGVSNLVIGGREVGAWLSKDKRVPLISATGSTAMGKAVGTAVAERLGKSLLELGGNNAIIISDQADLDMALIGCMFGAAGTAGQRCTTTRRLIIHEDVYEIFKAKLVQAYSQLKIGDPLIGHNHVGPLIDEDAVEKYLTAIKRCEEQGGNFIVEGGRLSGKNFKSKCYVKPCIAEVKNDFEIVLLLSYSK